MINIQNLNIKYADGHAAVENFSLKIETGQTVGLLGANGAGKSSLLLSFVGAVPIESGHIFVDETEVQKKTLNKIRRQVAMVFQNPDDQLFMTHVYEDVAFGPRNMGVSEEEVDRRVKSALTQLNILHLMKRTPSRLSGGEKRAVAIAGIIAMRPKVILFDEPTSFLDPKAKRTLMPVIKSLSGTKIIATHDFELAESICDRIILIKKGRFMTEGKPNKILADTELLEKCGL